jgi:hypothetical protein
MSVNNKTTVITYLKYRSSLTCLYTLYEIHPGPKATAPVTTNEVQLQTTNYKPRTRQFYPNCLVLGISVTAAPSSVLCL